MAEKFSRINLSDFTLWNSFIRETSRYEETMGLPIKVVQKTFKVVEFLNDQRTPSLHQLAELTGMPKPTVCRILDTL